MYFTLSDADFSPRTLTMLKSIRKYDRDSRLIFFHFEDLTDYQISQIHSHNIETKSIPAFIGEVDYSRLRNSRNYVELMWTLPSVLSENMIRLNKDTRITDVIYLDADLYFYASPNEILIEVPPGKISIVKHNFSNRLALAFPNSGTFNVSWVSFPVSEAGLECAAQWATNCNFLCPSVPTFSNGKIVYGDQLYLDEWPETYKDSIHVIQNIGVGVAPWNYENYQFSERLPFTVDGIPIIFFHFSSHQFGFRFARRMGRIYSAVKPIPKDLFRIYERDLSQAVSILGFRNWRSRYQPFLIRALNFSRRLFK